MWREFDVKGIAWHHSYVCQQDSRNIGIWDSDNGSGHTHWHTVTWEWTCRKKLWIKGSPLSSWRRGTFPMTMVISTRPISTSSPNSLQTPIDVSVSAFCFCLSTLYWPPFAVPFLSPPPAPCSDGTRLQSGIWWKKGSFLLFWISCFCRLPGEGVGWTSV